MAKKPRRSTPAPKPANRPLRPRPTAGADSLPGRMRAVACDSSPRELGRKTGFSINSVKSYLKGHPMKLRFLRNFARAYNLRIDWLLDGTGPKHRR